MRRAGVRAAAVSRTWRLADSVTGWLDALGAPVQVRGVKQPQSAAATGTEELVREHFRTRSSPDHLNLESMLGALSLLDEQPSRIVETGMSAWGTNSTLLFADYVDAFGGELWSVDIRLQPLVRVRPHVSERSVLTCGESVRFLERWVRAHRSDCRADLVYLDSFDLDFADPYPAALHGIKELLAIRPALRAGTLLLVDDTPATLDLCPAGERESAERFLATDGTLPGKGMLIDRYLAGSPQVTKLHHGYQALYRFDGGL